jgi:5-methylcytosine-specific restriction endonuclease McrA
MTTKKSRARTKAKLELLWRDGRRCAICGRKIKDLDDLTIDHIVPLAKGGKNAMENYQLAHKACNEAKGSMLPKEHMKIIRYNRRRILLMRIKKGIVVW